MVRGFGIMLTGGLLAFTITVAGGFAAADAPKSPSIVALRRTTESQYRHAIADVFGPSVKVGGYRPIQEAMDTWTKENPPGVELVSHVNLSAAWYAIKRFADARPDPWTGQNTAVSTAIRYSAVPAFVIKPDVSGPATVASAVQLGASRAKP